MRYSLHPRTRRNIQLNLLFSALLFFFGTTSVLVTFFSKAEENFFLEFRYMTLNGTIFTTLVSLITMLICVKEIRTGRESEQKRLYYFRLSSAVTESIIAVVIAMSFLPSVPDNPDLLSYESFSMHVVIPLLSIVSFLLNRSPAEDIHPLKRLNCSWLITVYAAAVIALILTGWLPQDKIPYSFLDFERQPAWYIVYFGCFIYSFSYMLSVMLSEWNRRIIRRNMDKVSTN